MEPTRLIDNNIMLGVDQRGVRPILATYWTTEDGLPRVSVGFQPSAEELERLNSGLPVIVHIEGHTIQPILVLVGEALEEETADG